MRFDPDDWRVTSLFVVPGHFITPTVVEERAPLRSDARRSGWIGSNLLLDLVTDAGRIVFVDGGDVVPREAARERFGRTAFLSGESADARDWTTAVMECLDDLELQPGEEFELPDVYAFDDRLTELYPENRHVRAKIRQQLQVLRDEGLVEFLGDGEYRLRP